MVRILVIPERLDSLGGQMNQAADELYRIRGRLEGAWGRVDWETRHRAGMDGSVRQASSRAGSLASEAQSMARYLAAKAQAFRQADEQGVGGLAAVSGPFSHLWDGRLGSGGVVGFPREPVDAWLRTGHIGKGGGGGGYAGAGGACPVPPLPGTRAAEDRLLTGYADLLRNVGTAKDWLAVGAAATLTYVVKEGNVIISGGGQLKEIAGMSPYLTRISPANIGAHMAKKSLGVGALLTFAPHWLEDYRDYRGDWSRLVGSLSVDTALVGITQVLPSAGGYIIGGVLVTAGAAALGVAAAPAAVVVGGVAVAAGVGWCGEQVYNWLDEVGARDWLIDRTAEGWKIIGDGVSATARRAAEGVDGALRSVTDAFQGIKLPLPI